MKAIKLSLFRLFPFAKYILYYDLKYQMIENPIRFLKICDNLMRHLHVSHAILKHKEINHTVQSEFLGARKRLEFLNTSKGVIHNLTQEIDDMDRQINQYSEEGFFDVINTQNPVLVDSAVIVFKNIRVLQRQHQQHQQQSAILDQQQQQQSAILDQQQQQQSVILDQQQQQQQQSGALDQQERFFCAWMNEVILFSRRDQLSYSYVENKLNVTGYKIPSFILLKFFQRIPHKYIIPDEPKERIKTTAL